MLAIPMLDNLHEAHLQHGILWVRSHQWYKDTAHKETHLIAR